MSYVSRRLIRMLSKLKRRAFRYMRKPSNIFRRRSILFIILAITPFILLGMREPKTVYTAGLLETIAKVESNKNYNAHFGNARNTDVRFTLMSVSEVMVWQNEFIKNGSPSSAVGRYQFLQSTLQNLTKQLQIEPNTRFDEQLQDRLATALLEKRGLRDYLNKKISREQFAHNLSKEWAALPKAIGENPEQSYYDGDGLNKARLSIKEVYASIATLHEI